LLSADLFASLATGGPQDFNTFVENSVEKGQSTSVSAFVRDALALCTEAGAGTFVVEKNQFPF
jgi:hypothetical protein